MSPSPSPSPTLRIMMILILRGVFEIYRGVKRNSRR